MRIFGSSGELLELCFTVKCRFVSVILSSTLCLSIHQRQKRWVLIFSLIISLLLSWSSSPLCCLFPIALDKMLLCCLLWLVTLHRKSLVYIFLYSSPGIDVISPPSIFALPSSLCLPSCLTFLRSLTLFILFGCYSGMFGTLPQFNGNLWIFPMAEIFWLFLSQCGFRLLKHVW